MQKDWHEIVLTAAAGLGLLVAYQSYTTGSPFFEKAVYALQEIPSKIHSKFGTPDVPAVPEVVAPLEQLSDFDLTKYLETATIVTAAAHRARVEANLVRALILSSSKYDPRSESPKGGMGLMHIRKSFAAPLGVRDPFDPRQNIDAGTKHLRALIDASKNDVERALAAYYDDIPPARALVTAPSTEAESYAALVMSAYRTLQITALAPAPGDGEVEEQE